MMNQEIKQKWVEALRSGEYIQGRECLHPFNQFCCLGVLCDVYRKQENLTHDEFWGCEVDGMNLWHRAALPPSVESVVGLTTPDQKTLAASNDNGTPFSEIADYIEENL